MELPSISAERRRELLQQGQEIRKKLKARLSKLLDVPWEKLNRPKL